MKSFEYIKEIFNEQCFSNHIVAEIIELLIREKRLDNYVDVISFNYDKNENDGAYLPNDNRLIINTNIISENAAKWYNREEIDKNDTNFTRINNLFLLNIIYHEINHVIQTKEADKKINDSLHKIIKDGIEIARRNPDKLNYNEEILYKYFYVNILTERNAEIMSLYTLSNFNQIFTKSELQCIKEKLISYMKFGYHGKATPAYSYYRLLKRHKEYKELSFDENYDVLTRISWGLPLNGKMSEKIKELKMSINV